MKRAEIWQSKSKFWWIDIYDETGEIVGLTTRPTWRGALKYALAEVGLTPKEQS